MVGSWTVEVLVVDLLGSRLPGKANEVKERQAKNCIKVKKMSGRLVKTAILVRPWWHSQKPNLQ